MYGLFYPGNDQRYCPGLEFETVDKAIDHMSMKNGFIRENPQGDEDLEAWINMLTGDIYVLRLLTTVEPDACEVSDCEEPVSKDGLCYAHHKWSKAASAG